jgi:hypothetical protein
MRRKEDKMDKSEASRETALKLISELENAECTDGACGAEVHLCELLESQCKEPGCGCPCSTGELPSCDFAEGC